jgi:hypothetical protein
MLATPNLPDTRLGGVTISTTRISAYWLCLTLLAYASKSPHFHWKLPAVIGFLLASSVAICSLGYVSAAAHRYLCKSKLLKASGEYPRSATGNVSHLGFIMLECIVVLFVLTALQRLLL